MINKSDIVQAILERLRRELHVIEEATSMANEEAQPADDITESQRENRALENQYLVDGQSRIAREHREAILAYETLPLRGFGAGEPAALTALVEVQSGGEKSLYFLGPRAGGVEITVAGSSVLVLTPQSPLGRTLLGRNIGETFAVEHGAVGRQATITALF
jgi:hypothetical protein